MTIKKGYNFSGFFWGGGLGKIYFLLRVWIFAKLYLIAYQEYSKNCVIAGCKNPGTNNKSTFACTETG